MTDTNEYVQYVRETMVTRGDHLLNTGRAEYEVNCGARFAWIGWIKDDLHLTLMVPRFTLEKQPRDRYIIVSDSGHFARSTLHHLKTVHPHHYHYRDHSRECDVIWKYPYPLHLFRVIPLPEWRFPMVCPMIGCGGAMMAMEHDDDTDLTTFMCRCGITVHMRIEKEDDE